MLDRLLRSQPRWDVLVLFILAACWVAMGSWSADLIAHIECDSLGGQRIPTKNGTMSYGVYCREMKAILALSWTNFVLLAISMAVLIALVIRVLSLGRQHHAWEESISEIPWFNQYGHHHHGEYGMYPMGQYPYMAAGGPIQTGPNQYIVQQAPGHAVTVGGGQLPGMAPAVYQTPVAMMG